MAQDMNLGKKKPAPPAQPTKEELIARVTSRPLPQPPPPAGGGPPQPLPEGKVVGVRAPSSLTPMEREAIENLGWDANMPISQQMAGIVQKVVAEKQQEIAATGLPIDPKTPPLKVVTKQLKDLTSEEKKAIQALSTANIAEVQQQADAERADQQLYLREMQTKGLIPAMQAVAQAEAFREQKRAQQAPSDEPLVDLSELETAQIGEAPQTPEQAVPVQPQVKPQAAEPAAKSDSGAQPQFSNCPHCDWPLHMTSPPEPAHADRMSFLHCMLGAKCWQKDYELFGGKVHIIFRTLSARELDAIYAQAYQDRDRAEFSSELDFWERVNRYRLFLQLQRMTADGPHGYAHDMADGLSPETNPEATGYWCKPGDGAELGEDVTPLRMVQKYMIENVLKTEALFRVVNTKCSEFNRLVAKLEVMADNSDFWKPTEEQS